MADAFDFIVKQMDVPGQDVIITHADPFFVQYTDYRKRACSDRLFSVRLLSPDDGSRDAVLQH